MTHTADLKPSPSVIVGRCEYTLADDGSVQHRLVGNITFLGCRDAQHPTPAEKVALEKLLAMEARCTEGMG